MADELIPEPADAHGAGAEVAASPRARRFLRLFLMVAGGLAAPCLALAAFFLTGSSGDAPAAKSASIAGGRVTATTGAATPSSAPARATAPSTSTTTTTAPVPDRPARDPFVPLVSQNSGAAPKG